MLYNSLDLYTLDINKPNLAAIDNDTDYYTHICLYVFLGKNLYEQESRFYGRHKAEV